MAKRKRNSPITKSNSLILQELREANVERCENFYHSIKAWNPAEWGCCVAGEVGELCNKLKKLHRGNKISLKSIAEEAADVIIYLDLLTASLDIDLAKAVKDKFNEKSKELKCTIRL